MTLINTSARFDYYAILGVGRHGTQSEIKAAYKARAIQIHPDKQLDNPEQAKQDFQILSEAYTSLVNTETRTSYNKFFDYCQLNKLQKNVEQWEAYQRDSRFSPNTATQSAWTPQQASQRGAKLVECEQINQQLESELAHYIKLQNVVAEKILSDNLKTIVSAFDKHFDLYWQHKQNDFAKDKKVELEQLDKTLNDATKEIDSMKKSKRLIYVAGFFTLGIAYFLQKAKLLDYDKTIQLYQNDIDNREKNIAKIQIEYDKNLSIDSIAEFKLLIKKEVTDKHKSLETYFSKSANSFDLPEDASLKAMSMRIKSARSEVDNTKSYNYRVAYGTEYQQDFKRSLDILRSDAAAEPLTAFAISAHQ